MSLTYHRGAAVARGGSCCGCCSVHLWGDQVKASTVGRSPGQLPVNPRRRQAECPGGVRSLHRQRIPQT